MRPDEEHEFLCRAVFTELENRNTGFDSPVIYHFSSADFNTVIDRCSNLHIGITGIEVFSLDTKLLEIEIGSEPGLDWARRLVHRYQGRSDVTLCASFYLRLNSSDHE